MKSDSIEYLVDLRTRLRTRKHFKLADMVKTRLLEKNVLLFDNKNVTTWEYKHVFEEKKRDESAEKRFEAWLESVRSQKSTPYWKDGYEYDSTHQRTGNYDHKHMLFHQKPIVLSRTIDANPYKCWKCGSRVNPNRCSNCDGESKCK